MRGCDRVIRTLLANGVNRAFSLSGNHIMSLYDAAFSTGFEILHVRHEAAAVHMADAVGRATARPGVAFLTGGPGHANGMPAMYTAQFSESPLVVISGHAPLDHMGKGAFQELKQADFAAPVAKAAWTVERPELLEFEVNKALHLAAAGRPGPISLNIPSDLLEMTAGEQASPAFGEKLEAKDEEQLDPSLAQQFVELVGEAERPIMLVSPFMNRGHAKAEIHALTAALDVPWASMESPRGMSEPSLGALGEVLPRADLVFLFGKRVDFTLGFGGAPIIAPEARIIQIDPEKTALERTERLLAKNRIALSTVADLVPAARVLTKLASDRGAKSTEGREWTRQANQAIAYRPREWETLCSSTASRVHPAEVGRALRSFLARHQNSALIADGGEFGQWCQGILDASTRITNGPAGAIGAGPPFAAGVRSALPEASVVVACMGDGSVGFHFAEFDTAVRHNLPYIAVVGNDAAWNAEKMIQKRDFGADRMYGCDLLPTRYDLAVQAFGGHGEFVTRAEDLPGALDRALASGKPALVNVMIESLPAPSIKLPM